MTSIRQAHCQRHPSSTATATEPSAHPRVTQNVRLLARAFASKAAEHAARLAGVMTIFADPEALTVMGETMADAVKLATFYANEAARLHAAAVTPPHVQDAERMRQWLLGSWKEDYISAAVATQRGPFKLTDRSRKALSLLETHGYLISAPGDEVDGKTRREAWKIVRGV